MPLSQRKDNKYFIILSAPFPVLHLKFLVNIVGKATVIRTWIVGINKLVDL